MDLVLVDAKGAIAVDDLPGSGNDRTRLANFSRGRSSGKRQEMIAFRFGQTKRV